MRPISRRENPLFRRELMCVPERDMKRLLRETLALDWEQLRKCSPKVRRPPVSGFPDDKACGRLLSSGTWRSMAPREPEIPSSANTAEASLAETSGVFWRSAEPL